MRLLSNWLVEWTSYYHQTEVPESFAIWSGIWAISSILQNNAFLQMGPKELYPNMYIMLIGVGAGGKSLPSREAFKLLDATGQCEMYSGEMTKSFFVSYLDELESRSALAGGQRQARIAMYSDELAVTVSSGPQAAEFLRVMTQLYDFSFTYSTHRHGQKKVYNPVISWLSLTTPPWLRLSVPPDLVDSGFVARIIAVKEPLSQKSVPRLPVFDGRLRMCLLHDLYEISLIKGEYYLSSEAADYHDIWYDINRASRLAITDEVTQGIYGREDEHVYKVAMTLMAAQGDSMEITQRALLNAIQLVTRARESNVQLFQTLATGSARWRIK